MSLPKVIDVHSHILYEPNVKGVWEPITRGVITNWTPQTTLEMMDANNIGIKVLSYPGANTWNDVALCRGNNESYARLIGDHPDRFGGFITLPTSNMDATLKEIEYAFDVLKLDGVCLTSNVEGVYLGDARFAEMWQELNKRNAVAFVHPTNPAHIEATRMGYQRAILEFMFDTTRMVTSMVYSGTKRRNPNVKVIATHGGGVVPYIAWRIAYFAQLFGVGNGQKDKSDLVLDDLKSFYFDLTAAATNQALPTLLSLVPHTQLLMGFDYPQMEVSTFLPAQKFVREYEGLTETQKVDIFDTNARKIMPQLGRSR
jgi:predicted TIM-barrel fold metal-dependent hydrolase